MNRLKVGDTIQCHDKDEMVDIFMALQEEDIDSDFLYEKDGEKRLWLIITECKQKPTMTTTEGASQVSYESLYIPKSVIEDIRAEIEGLLTNAYDEGIKEKCLAIIDKHTKAVEE